MSASALVLALWLVDVCACVNAFHRQRITYEPKWTIPLFDLSLDDKIAVEGRNYYCCFLQ